MPDQVQLKDPGLPWRPIDPDAGTWPKEAIPESMRRFFKPVEVGQETTLEDYIANLVAIFREVRRVLRDDGTLWLNMGDTYVGATSQHKEGGSAGRNSIVSKKTMGGIPTSGRGARNRSLYASGLAMKQLIGIPWRLALALQADGWFLRQDIIWNKTNAKPESVNDRCTRSHEYLFLLTKKAKYFFDAKAIDEPGRKRRSVWTVPTRPYAGAHCATYPPDLIRPCILAGCPEGGTVLDPFAGSGTTAKVALDHGRRAILCELSPDYLPLIHERCR